MITQYVAIGDLYITSGVMTIIKFLYMQVDISNNAQLYLIKLNVADPELLFAPHIA